MITVEFDQMVRFWVIHVLQGKEVFIECILINLGIATVDNLNGLTMMCLAWGGLQYTLPKEYLSTKDDDGGVPCCQQPLSPS